MALETKYSLEQQTIDALQDLIQINLDSRDGFHKVAEKIDNLSVVSMFQDLGNERQQQASELQSLVAGNAETPQQSGSMAAAVHRTWIDLRTALGGGLLTCLEEAERGEDHIKAKYEEVLTDTAGSAVNDVLQRQYAAVKAAHDRIRDMRDALKEK